MSLIIKDRIKEVTTTTGTGAISLGGATATFETFSSYMTNGDTTYYAIVHTASGVDEWEVGVGTWNTGNTLTRTTVIAGTNDGSPVDFSAGPKDIFMTYPASVAAYTDGSGDLSADIGLGNHSTSELVEGSNLYYTDARVDAHLSGGTGVTYSSGAISIGQDVATTADVTFNTVTLAGDPTTALQAATKEYVDTIAAAGIHYHEPVRVEAPVNLPATYSNGSSGVGATLTNSGTQAAITIDGVALSSADRVLVYQQTNPAHNGIYTVTTVGSGSTNWVLTRATDADSYGVSDKDAMGEGDAYFVKEGATGAGELYVMNTSGAITFGTTPISFTVIAETAVYSAGTGLTLTGTTFAAEQDIATTASPTFNTVTADLVGDTSGTHTGAVVGNVTGNVTGNAGTATALATSRTIQLTGDVIGSATFNGTANATLTATVQDDSHSHVISNVDGLQSALDAKADDTTTITAGSGLTGGGSIGVNRTISHADTSTQASLVALSGAAVVSDVDVDTYGHVTGLSTRNMTLADLGYTGETNATADQTITAGAGLTGGGTGNVTLNHADTSSQASVNNSGGTVIQDITLDTYGHLTGITSYNLDGRYYTETEADSRFVNASGDAMTGNLSFGDNDKAIFGAGSDLQIYHDGNHSYIDDGGTGNLYVRATNFRINNAGNTQQMFSADDGGAVMLFNSGALKLATTATGIDVTGTVTADGMSVGANNVFHDGYHPNADKWTTARTLSLTGDASGSVSWDGSGNASLSVTVADDSHNHTIANVDGLQTALDGKLSTSGKAADANLLDGYDYTAFNSSVLLYHTSGSATRYKIRLPFNTNSVRMLKFTISMYQSYTQHDYEVAGYLYPSTNQWYLPTVVYKGTGTPDIVVGRDGDGRAYVSVAGGSYTGVRVHSVTIGYNGSDADAYNQDWSIASTTDVSNSVTPSIYKVWTSGNDGSGSGLDADLLDGQQGSYYYPASNPNGYTTYTANQALNTTSNPTFNDVYVADQILHSGDTNTYMQFHAGDQWRVVTGGAERLEVNNSQVTVTGDFLATGNVTAYSDERLKSNIQTIDNAVDTVKKLRGVTFEKDGADSLGVIAQEVQKVLPELVFEGEEYLSVAYGNMVGLLIEAIKEQQKQIDELRAKVQ